MKVGWSTITAVAGALFIITALILVNALYVAAEFAAVGVRRSRVRRLADDGNRLAISLLPVVEDGRKLDRYIAASQIGITLSSLVLGAYGQATLADPLSPWFVGLGVDPENARSTAAVSILIALTAAQVVVGELMPKTLALQYPTVAALGTVLPMRWSLRIFAPFIWLLNGSGVLLLRLFRVTNTGHRHIHSPEEIDLLIAESRDGGLLEPEEQVRLHRALRLGLRTARELMVKREDMAAISADLPFDAVVEAAVSSPYTRLPVFRGSLDRIIGFVRTKDVVVHWATHGGAGELQPLLRPMSHVAADTPADRLLAFLRNQRAHIAIVIEGEGQVAGLVTLQDVLAHLLGRAPEEPGGPRRDGGRG
jgi:CBS domain containing-hemolysin-like protein